MTTPNENPKVPETPVIEPFPKTNTMPSGWDMSGLTPDPEPDSASSADDTDEEATA